ncbi:uncharacterized protein [Misgurnus anguillicaudatus]|uniref:uncharacterized protein isoform X4 n=1 Tax=Misgurnus anguillicaudatus TaxID=75329 RepID=UPI003CCFD69A
MAGQQSPVKRLRKTVNGHLCNISPIKDKQKPYFEAFLHHEGECCKVVAFKEEDYMNFQNAEKTQSPVTLQNVIVQPSKSNGRTNVYYTHTSKMSCVRDISHAFKNTLPDEPQDIKLSELPKLDINHLRININVKIILEEYKGHNVVWDGRYLPKTVYTVADTTGYMTICNNVIVKMEESKCPLTESDQVMASLAVTDPADVYSPPDLRLFFSSQRQKRNLSIDSKPKRSKDHQSLVAIRAVHRIL